MCGIVGLVARERFGLGTPELVSMLDSLRHRGPDDSGLAYWLRPETPGGECQAFVGIGASRLSLVDMSRGTQPFTGTGGARLVFNGEIYNARTLRESLTAEGRVFRSTSDTEVLLALWESRGLDGLAALDGMFALAIAHDGRLTLARDRYGMKPLYLASDRHGWLAFASEAKAMLRVGLVSSALDPSTLLDVGVFGFPLASSTFFENIEQVRPGTAMSVILRPEGLDVQEQRFATLPRSTLLPPSSEDRRPPHAGLAAEALAHALVEAVDAHLEADHPVGIFLSGGVDSSCLVGAARAAGHRDIHTFTLGDGPDLDDVRAARQVASSLGTRHHEVIMDFDTFLGALPTAVGALEAPRPPTGAEFLSAEARGHVKAALCGEGSDEVFAGYWSHADPAAFVRASLERYLSMYRIMAVDDPAIAARSKVALRLLGRRDTAERERQTWLFFIRDQLANAHLVPWDHITMSKSLELRLPYLSLRILDVVERYGFDFLRPLGRKTMLRLAAQELLPPDMHELVINRKKLGFPSNVGSSMTRLSEVARAIVPEEHLRRHPLGPLYESTRLALTGVGPQPRRPQNTDLRDAAAVLLFDLFVLIFSCYRGTVPEGLTPHTLYTDAHWLKQLFDALDDLRQDIRFHPSDIGRQDLIREALARGDAELEPDDRL